GPPLADRATTSWWSQRGGPPCPPPARARGREIHPARRNRTRQPAVQVPVDDTHPPQDFPRPVRLGTCVELRQQGMFSAHGRSDESEDTRGLDEDDHGDEGAAMKSARSGSAAFGIVASAALVSSGVLGSLLGAGPAAEAATVSAPNVCGQPPARATA